MDVIMIKIKIKIMKPQHPASSIQYPVSSTSKEI